MLQTLLVLPIPQVFAIVADATWHHNFNEHICSQIFVPLMQAMLADTLCFKTSLENVLTATLHSSESKVHAYSSKALDSIWWLWADYTAVAAVYPQR